MPSQYDKIPSKYQAVWLIALFDLPTDTKTARRAYTDFRKGLLKNGFSMLQFSVYGRYCNSEDRAEVLRQRLKKILPPDGEIRLMSVTDAQYGKMQIYHGKRRKAPEKAPEQIQMF